MLSTRFTVLFVPPFWEGILERQDGRRYETARVVFGAEPTEQEVWEFVLHRLPRLPTGSRIQTAEAAPRIRNPKRLQRSIAREQRNAVGKKAWAALAASREEQKGPAPQPYRRTTAAAGAGEIPKAHCQAPGETPGTLTGLSKQKRDSR